MVKQIEKKKKKRFFKVLRNHLFTLNYTRKTLKQCGDYPFPSPPSHEMFNFDFAIWDLI